jgi:hypothetical protein
VILSAEALRPNEQTCDQQACYEAGKSITHVLTPLDRCLNSVP